jgi:hypothetical protein
MIKMNENKLQSECNKLLKFLHIPYKHIEKGRGVNKAHSGGFPDLIFMRNKQFYMVELKFGNNKTSDKQIECLRQWELEGTKTKVIYDFEEFKRYLMQENII